MTEWTAKAWYFGHKKALRWWQRQHFTLNWHAMSSRGVIGSWFFEDGSHHTLTVNDRPSIPLGAEGFRGSSRTVWILFGKQSEPTILAGQVAGQVWSPLEHLGILLAIGSSAIYQTPLILDLNTSANSACVSRVPTYLINFHWCPIAAYFGDHFSRFARAINVQSPLIGGGTLIDTLTSWQRRQMLYSPGDVTFLSQTHRFAPRVGLFGSSRRAAGVLWRWLTPADV